MATGGTAFILAFNQYGNFLGIEPSGVKLISTQTHNMMRDIPHGRPVARKSLGEWIRLDLGDGRYAYCWHNLDTCDCYIWRREDWTGDLRFTLSFDQYGNFVNIRFADGGPIDMPDHNMMKGMPIGHPVASRSLGELMRLELKDGGYAYCYHLPTCDCPVLFTDPTAYHQ